MALLHQKMPCVLSPQLPLPVTLVHPVFSAIIPTIISSTTLSFHALLTGEMPKQSKGFRFQNQYPQIGKTSKKVVTSRLSTIYYTRLLWRREKRRQLSAEKQYEAGRGRVRLSMLSESRDFKSQCLFVNGKLP